MMLILRWVVREIKNDAAWSLLLVVCLSFGLLGITVVESLRVSIEDQLQLSARKSLSADFAFSSRREILAKEISEVRSILNPNSESHQYELYTMMAGEKKRSQLVLAKAVDANYPIYGEIKLSNGYCISGELKVGPLCKKTIRLSEYLSSGEVLVYPEIMRFLNLKIGDQIQIGEKSFIIKEIIQEDETQTFRLATLAPKVYLLESDLQSSGLVKFGSTLTESYLFKLNENSPEQGKNFLKIFEHKFQDPNLQFTYPFDQANASSRVLQYLLDYLGLVSIIGLIISIMGAFYFYQFFLSRRILTWALLQVLGMSRFNVRNFIVLELTIISLFSFLIIAPAAYLLLKALEYFFQNYLDLKIILNLQAESWFLSGLLLLLLPALLSWPLFYRLEKKQLKSVVIDRQLWDQGNSEKKSLIDYISLILRFIPLLAAIYLLCLWVSHSWFVSSIFALAVFISGLLILFVSVFILKRIPMNSGLWYRKLSYKRLARAPLRFSMVILSVALGSMILTFIPQIQSSLKSELSMPKGVPIPSLFLFDIQDEQNESLKSYLNSMGIRWQENLPLIRSRITKVNGVEFERSLSTEDQWSRESEAEARFRNRGVNLTEKNELGVTEKIVEGKSFSQYQQGTPEISLEVKYAKRLGLKLDDMITFDVQGFEFEARVVNLRKVQWNSFQPNFFIVTQKGFLDDAPKTWLMSLPKMSDVNRDQVQDSLVEKYSNVTAIDIRRLVGKILEITDQMSQALILMAIISVTIGGFLLAIVLSLESQSRKYEWALYKALGSSKNQISKIYLSENIVLIGWSTFVGSILGLVLVVIICIFIFDVSVVLNIPVLILANLIPLVFGLGLSWIMRNRVINESTHAMLSEGRLQ